MRETLQGSDAGARCIMAFQFSKVKLMSMRAFLEVQFDVTCYGSDLGKTLALIMQKFDTQKSTKCKKALRCYRDKF